ncbi:MAG TPA: twin-arginine translocase subunit TatC [Candidatus Saccharimonadales bacterium]|nr:twin-arginine translocase subunit TatC [Candidatus Saccharimonadales bacterium]
MEEKTLLSHLTELRTRVFWVVVFLLIGAGIGYALYDHILQVLIHPLNQTLYYTKPGGGLELMLKICLLVGALLAVPMALFQAFSFLKPLLRDQAKLFIFYLTLCSIFLLALGITFSYFIALPASLKFLMEFSTNNIQALITTDSYLSFVLVNLAIAALMFQLPIILIFIDRIKPLKPKKLLLNQHWVILVSFVLAAIVTPTIDPINQCLIAVPIIILYDVAVASLWIFGSKQKSAPKTRIAEFKIKEPAPKTYANPHQTLPRVRPAAPVHQAVRPKLARSIDGFARSTAQQPVRAVKTAHRPTLSQVQPPIFVQRRRLIQL